MTSPFAGRRPVIHSHLGAALAQALADHPSRPVIRSDTESATPWIVPGDTDILLTRGLPGWRQAPATPPPGFPALHWVQVMSAGVDFYPGWLLDAAPLSTGQGLTAGAIADYVLAAILLRVKPLVAHAARPGDWTMRQLGRVPGQRVGLVGYGAIGQQIARRALALGMQVQALRRRPDAPPENGVGFVPSVEALMGWADHLVLAAPATAETRGMISGARLLAARPGLHLINVSRGDLVDQAGLLAALDAGIIGHATLDVTTPEPLPDDHPLLHHPRVLITPHIAWSDGSNPELALADRVVRGLDALIAGQAPAYLLAR